MRKSAKMLEWACNAAQQSDKDLLELYCGNGNFTLPLSTRFRRALATELAKSSVYAAEWNIEQNGIDNIQVARLSAEEFTQAFNGERTFRRLQEANIDLSTYDFDTVFVDPPRAGIDDETLKLLQRFERIIYISCNPDTLHDNLKQLSQTHKITKFALFDQFPLYPSCRVRSTAGKTLKILFQFIFCYINGAFVSSIFIHKISNLSMNYLVSIK